MNKKLTVLLLVTCIYSYNSFANELFTGHWSGGEQNESTLTLRLTQDGQTISGSYCYITHGGNRIDCPEQDKNNLKGTVITNQASIEFDSSFGATNGRATLKVKGNEMVWDLITPPQKGEFYAPQHYILNKISSPHAAEKRKFATDKFTVTLVNKCGEFESACDDMFYLGVRNSDNSTITLNGKTLSDSSGKIIGSIYKNGDVTYTVNYEPVKLMVSKNNHVLLEQTGQWLKQ